MYLIDNKYVKNIKRQKQNDCPFCRKVVEICHFALKWVTGNDYNPNDDKMKKMFITPQKDTVTLCLPSEWVGKPLVCTLSHPDEKSAYPDDSEFVTEMREDSFIYNAELYKRKHHRPRKKRLRRKRGGKNKYL